MSKDTPVFDNSDFHNAGPVMPTARDPMQEHSAQFDLDAQVSKIVDKRSSDSQGHQSSPKTNLAKAFEEVLLAIQSGTAPDHLTKELAIVLPSDVLDDYDETFDMKREIGIQMNMIKGLRHSVFKPNGRLEPGVEFKDAKYVLESSNKMISVLMNHQKQLINVERMQAVEASVIDVLDTMPPEHKSLFLEKLKEKLAK